MKPVTDREFNRLSREKYIMIKARHSQVIEDFIFFIEQTLSLLAEEKYDDFLAMYDSSRISREGLLLALRYLDDSWPIVKVDDPMKVECSRPRIYNGQFKDGSGYWVDYDLTTNGELNDLTLQVAFLKQGTDYSAELSDLHTM